MPPTRIGFYSRRSSGAPFSRNVSDKSQSNPHSKSVNTITRSVWVRCCSLLFWSHLPERAPRGTCSITHLLSATPGFHDPTQRDSTRPSVFSSCDLADIRHRSGNIFLHTALTGEAQNDMSGPLQVNAIPMRSRDAVLVVWLLPLPGHNSLVPSGTMACAL